MGVARALQQVRADVSWLEDLFPHTTKDPVWLAQAGVRDWLVVTRDKKIRTRPAEPKAAVDNAVGWFCITEKIDPTRWQYLQILAKHLDEMERLFGQEVRPFLYGLTLGAIVKIDLA